MAAKAAVKKTKRLTKKDRRIAVAKDVLKQLRMKKLRPVQGLYFRQNQLVAATAQSEDDLQKFLKEAKRPCEACALGSMMLAYARLYDDATLQDAYEPYQSELLAEIFSISQMGQIESAFEAGFASGEGAVARLKEIMENIVENEGTFRII